ncbi:hypothetical protein D9615_007639 [Tricholomella constricta]|uniref:Uncharacterized protein n=1 Tax=Tricholomella constricta TaxID=117010 RepID=A0A8H5H7E5_9AGAR|nr:hypothetical protein D9615_007639 [Tricholomella constricta]
MSTVRYNLRLRPSAVASAGPISDSGESPIAESFAEISPPSANLELDPAELVEAQVTTNSPARSYSSVVRSGLNEPRSPSPVEENALPTLNDIIAERTRLECRSWAQVKEDERRSLEARRKAAEALGHDRFWEQGGRWFTTTHRRPRAQSLEGARQLTRSQADTVRQAEEGMNSSQQNLLRRREQAAQATREEQTPEYRGEGTSKGKNPDPRNWGTAGIPEEELDVAAQQAALGAYEAQRISEEINSPELSEIHSAAVNIELMNENQNLRAELAKLKKDKATLKKKKAEKQKAKRADARTLGKSEMRPSTQLAPKSYLGSVLKGMDNSSDEDGNTSSDPSDSSDSDTSESSSSSSSDGSDSSSEIDKKKRKRRSKRCKKSSKKKTSKTRIRPVEPEKYNGEPDPKVFHRFATQSKAYRLEDTLTRHQPYPGDCISNEEKRFSAYRTANGMHVIIDFERDSDLNGECVLIPSALVEDGEFDIPEWYAEQLLRVPPSGRGCRACTGHRTKCEPVQDPLAARAEEVLKSGTPYPGDADQEDRDDDQRFEVWRDRGVEGVYVLYDKALDFHRQIPADCLRNEKFNLVKCPNTANHGACYHWKTSQRRTMNGWWRT